MTAFHGYEAGWFCLSACSLDVAVNALAVLWATSGISEEADSLPLTLPHIAISLNGPSAYHEDYSVAPANPVPKEMRRRLCPNCFAYYTMDGPRFMAVVGRWNHAATLPLELEAGPRDVQLGRAPPDIDDDYAYPDMVPTLQTASQGMGYRTYRRSRGADD